ncbi:MAG: hypothetical protein DCF22_24050 [Leptolyngbya sp.]|nr:MAG: hypothetical protein DCF22_24050 [Leptolyngbya sp.]
MQNKTPITDPHLEIAKTLFEARAKIRYALAVLLVQRLLTTAQRDSLGDREANRLERLLSAMEGTQSTLEEMPG